MEVDAKAIGDHALEIEAPPSHDAVDFAVRARFDDRRQFSQLRRRQAPLPPARPMVQEPIRPSSIEPVNPVAKLLSVHAADVRRLAPTHPILDRRQRQQAPALIDVL